MTTRIPLWTRIAELFTAREADDVIVHTGREAILAAANLIEGKSEHAIMHLVNGSFARVNIVKVLNGDYFITEESGLFRSKTMLLKVREITSLSLRRTSTR